MNWRAFRALVIAFSPLLIVRLAWWSLDRLPIESPALHVVAGAFLLTVVSFAVIARHDGALAPVAWRDTMLRLLVTGAGFVALAVWAGIAPSKILGGVGMATLCAAFAEEIVFRRWIPNRLSQDDAPSAGVSLVLPQISFSLAHAANPSFIAARPMEFVSLFIAGLLYRGLTEFGGLGMAAAVHAALNLALA